MALAADSARPRVAFSNLSHLDWTAGAHYLRNLFIALHSLGDERPQIDLLVCSGATPDSYSRVDGLQDRILEAPRAPEPSFLERQKARVERRLGVYREPASPLLPYLKSEGVQTVFVTSTDYGSDFDLPLLSWIPDFQYVHLPEMFGDAEVDRRNREVMRISAHAARVVLSSEDALRDLRSVSPSGAERARVMHFVAQVPESAYEGDPTGVCSEYHLPERFFYLPNQFWRHKNHEVVIEALRITREREPGLAVVATGSSSDHRNSLYFADLVRRVSNLGVRDQFIYLGLVPGPDLFRLMRQSVALLQPSLFEGWSTTVEEAKSLGKRVVLSDLPVHKEQDPPGGVYFERRSPESLAQALVAVYREASPGPDRELEQQARECLPERTREFGRTFCRIVREVVQPS
jgi:glycosyltransferase involved in cell wall biosynthesis